MAGGGNSSSLKMMMSGKVADENSASKLGFSDTSLMS